MDALTPIVPTPIVRSESVSFKRGPRGESQIVRTIIDPLVPVPITGAAA